jgi:hypothetical protein
MTRFYKMTVVNENGSLTFNTKHKDQTGNNKRIHFQKSQVRCQSNIKKDNRT